jgi:hypothetical protein
VSNPGRCQHCGMSKRADKSQLDIHYSNLHRAWLCLRCHLREPK